MHAYLRPQSYGSSFLRLNSLHLLSRLNNNKVLRVITHHWPSKPLNRLVGKLTCSRFVRISGQ